MNYLNPFSYFGPPAGTPAKGSNGSHAATSSSAVSNTSITSPSHAHIHSQSSTSSVPSSTSSSRSGSISGSDSAESPSNSFSAISRQLQQQQPLPSRSSSQAQVAQQQQFQQQPTAPQGHKHVSKHFSTSIDDESVWKPALHHLHLDLHLFLNTPVDPALHLTERTLVEVAPTILEQFPAVGHLRYKLVPARLNEERFWRTLFTIIRSYHGGGHGSAAAASPEVSAEQQQQQHAHSHATATTTTSALPKKKATAVDLSRPSATPPPMNGTLNNRGSASPTAASSPQQLNTPGVGLASPAPMSNRATLGALQPLQPLQPLAPLQPLQPMQPLQPPAAIQQQQQVPPPVVAAAAPPAGMPIEQQRLMEQQFARREGELLACLKDRDEQLLSRSLEVAILRKQLESVTAQLSSVLGALQHSVAIASAQPTTIEQLESMISSEQRVVLSSPPPLQTPAAASPAPVTSPTAVASPSSESEKPREKEASAPTCPRCRASSATSECTHHGGEWALSKSSQEFFQFPQDLRTNLRKEKARRLEAVKAEMKFIVDSDDPNDAPGSWTCCSKEEFAATGCKVAAKHAPLK